VAELICDTIYRRLNSNIAQLYCKLIINILLKVFSIAAMTLTALPRCKSIYNVRPSAMTLYLSYLACCICQHDTDLASNFEIIVFEDGPIICEICENIFPRSKGQWKVFDSSLFVFCVCCLCLTMFSDDLSSISGSGSDSDETTTIHTTSADAHNDDDDCDYDEKRDRALPPTGSPYLQFGLRNKNDVVYSLFRKALSHTHSPISGSSLYRALSEFLKPQVWIILMRSGGHFAGAVYRR